MSRRRKQQRRRPAPKRNLDPGELSEILEELHDNPDTLSVTVRRTLGTTYPDDPAPAGCLAALRCTIADHTALAPHAEPTGFEWASTWAAPIDGTDAVVIHHATGKGEHYNAVATYITTRDEVIAREHDMGVDVAELNPWRNGGTPSSWGCEVIAVAADGGLAIALRDTSGTLGCDRDTFDSVRTNHLDGLVLDTGNDPGGDDLDEDAFAQEGPHR